MFCINFGTPDVFSLDLDEWINEPSPESSEEEIVTTGLFYKPSEIQENQLQYKREEPTENDLEEVK